jgi:hypothetical protein
MLPECSQAGKGGEEARTSRRMQRPLFSGPTLEPRVSQEDLRDFSKPCPSGPSKVREAEGG